MRYLRLLALFVRTELQFELAYRVNFLAELLSLAVTVATSVAAVLILFAYTQTLNGWSLPAMLVLLGVFYIVQGLGELAFMPSFQQFMEQVRLGTLDFVLLKPASSQFLVSVRYFKLSNIFQLALSVIVTALGFAQLGGELSSFAVAAFAVALFCGMVLIYVLLLCLSTLAFWFVRVENLLAVYEAFLDAGRFPVDIYPGWLRVTMSTIIPIGIAITVPAQAVAGRLDALGLSAMVAVTIAAWIFARWFWRIGLRSYTGASA
jgi:ABC-2 type transport system permease protein